mgnify:CR=1 FL=1
MKIESSIRKKIESEFTPDYYELENESHKHSGGPNRETHFRTLIVSDFFSGKSRVERARIVHDLLAGELSGGVHALSQRMFTLDEWARLSNEQKLMISPSCLGRAKKR